MCATLQEGQAGIVLQGKCLSDDHVYQHLSCTMPGHCISFSMCPLWHVAIDVTTFLTILYLVIIMHKTTYTQMLQFQQIHIDSRAMQ